ncbi:MAG: flavoprotein [Leptospiraceae bacterium]|mgnify:FL=1|nr:flavoprotein [Leptospiraceae bacterium]
MHISVISGSPRKDSNSLRVSRALAKNLTERGHQCPAPIDFHNADIPLVGRGSLDSNNLSSFQEQLIDSMRASSLVIFVVPEYNWITSGEIINAIHQIGNKDLKDVFHNRTFAMVGVSTGRGGRRPAIEMQTLVNKMISFTDGRAIVSPRLLESHETEKNLDAQGESLGNAIYEKTMNAFLDYSLDITEMWFAGR